MDKPARRATIKVNGREVHNPAARALVAIAAVGITAVVITMTLVAVTLTIVPLLLATLTAVAIALTLHPVLRATGRRGFVHRDGRSTTVKVSTDGFRRRADPTR